ncbi:MAG: glycosyltransferase family 2 protein [Bacteroidales bacterium]|nr:glycosyltransferase family 2 protein [Bacteroidales bacterium]
MEEPLVSIVVSVYNEEESLQPLYNRLQRVMSGVDYQVEVIMVNDGSRDKSREIINNIASTDSRFRGIHFSRNFGHEAAMIAGIDHAFGDAVVCIDADLQNPPELIADMVKLYLQGNDIVTMTRLSRADGGVLKRVTSRWFYKLINSMSEIQLQENASDFFLISRRVAEVLRTNYRERTRFLRGIIQNIGFNISTINYEAPSRKTGSSHYSIHQLASLAFTSIASFSKMPLKLGIYTGIAFGVLSIILIVYSLVMWIIQRPTGGYTTLITFMCLFAAVILTVTGTIGYYIGIMLDEVKARPIYLIESTTHDSIKAN